MRVYLDVVFVLNGAVNALLLGACARLTGASGGRGRRLAAAGFGGLYACASFLPGFGFLGALLWRGIAMGLMLLLAFGVRRRTLRAGAMFLALSMALGGLVMALSGFLGAKVWLLEGRAFYFVGFRTLVLLAGLLYLGAWLVLQGSMAHAGGEIVTARVELCGAGTELSMLRDNGNTLRDPFTGERVPVIERAVLCRLLPGAEKLDPAKAPQAMEQLRRQDPAIPARLIPFRAVGTERALLLAVRCDALRAAGKTRKGVYVAISPTTVSEHGEYEGLLGGGDWDQ